MSLGVVIKSTEGLVIAADSRVTVMAMQTNPAAPPNTPAIQFPVNFDNATKILTFPEPHNHIAAVTFGQAAIGSQMNDMRTAHGYVSEFVASLGAKSSRMPVGEFAKRFSDFFLAQWNLKMPKDMPPGSGMFFIMAGFNKNEPYGHVYRFGTPTEPEPMEQMANDFGIVVGGQGEMTQRIMAGFDPNIARIVNETDIPAEKKQEILTKLGQLQVVVPFALLPLQDCIDLATFLVRTTSAIQNLSIGLRGVGGVTEVAVITSGQEGAKFVQQKVLSVEGSGK